MRIEYRAQVTAADAGRRTITGIVAPYGAVGHTSAGPVVFEAGAFGQPDADSIRFLLEHDHGRPIGKATSIMASDDGVVGTFRVAGTTAGSDALIEAAEGLRDGLSVGASLDSWEARDGAIHVTAATIHEVSLVSSPAFPEARVVDVAASAADSPTTTEQETTTMPDEQHDVEVAEELVEAAAPAPAHVTAAASLPFITSKPRGLESMTAGAFAKVQLAAQAGDHESQLIVRAALDDNTTTTAAGLVPTRYLRDVIGVLDTTRPFIDSIERNALPDAGTEFKIPRRTARASVAEQANEGDEISSDEPTYDFLTVDVKTFAGGERISRQLIERSDPAFLDRLILEMTSEYAQKVDNFAWLTVANTLGAGSESNGASIAEAIGQAIADSWGVMRFAPNNLAVAPSTTGSFGYADILKAVDADDRPLFAASGTLVNAGGTVGPATTNGSVMGLRLVVDGNMAGDSNALVYPTGAATFYEVAGAPIQVSVQDVSTLEVEVAVYGYVAMAVKYPTAIRYLTVGA